MHIYNKYKIKTYSGGIQNNISDLEIEKKGFFINCENNNCSQINTEKNIILKTTFQPKCIFTRKNNNISFYQSTYKRNNKTFTNKNLTPLVNKRHSINTNKISLRQSNNFEEEKFSCNYTSLKGLSQDKTNEKSTLNSQILDYEDSNGCKKFKPFKNQFNAQKRDYFKIPNEQIEYNYDTNYNINKKNSKLNQIYRKQGVDEFFFPSQKTYSRQDSSLKKKKKDKYQSRTLKFQSFFGSFNSKDKRMTKSTSRIKVNQLGDFNIDKLIEIGDKYANLGKPLLSLGKLMNNNIIYHHLKIKKNKFKIPINNRSNNYKKNEVKEVNNYSKDNHKVINEDFDYRMHENKSYIFNDKKRIIKKIASKHNLKNGKTVIIQKIGDNKGHEYENTVKKILDFNTDIKNRDIINSSIKYSKKHTKYNTKKDLDISDNDNNNKIFRENKGKEILKKKLKKNLGNFDLIVNNNNNNEKSIYMSKRARKLIINDENNSLNSNIIIPEKFCENKEIILTENKTFIKGKVPYNNFYIDNN